jgi:trigger factor
MDVHITQSGPCRKTLTIRLSKDGIRSHVEDAFRTAAQHIQEKGFRPGKVPRNVIEKKYGSAIRAEAKESLVQRSFEAAIREHKLAVVGRPSVSGLDEKPLDENQELEFEVTLEVRPEIALRAVKGVEVRAASTEATDADVEQALQEIAGQKKTMQPSSDPIGANDFAKGNLVFRDAAGLVAAERKGVQLSPKIPVAGTDAEGFASKLTGANKGDVVSLPLTFPDNFEVKALRGQPGTVEFTIENVLRITPAPIDDSLAAGLDLPDLAALKAELRRRLGDEKQRLNRLRIEDEVIGQLLNENPFDLPASLVEDQQQHQLQLLASRLQEARMPDAEVQQRVEQARASARQDAERRIRVFFLLDAVARSEKIFVTEADVEVELKRVAAQNQVSPEVARRYYEENRLLGDLRVGIMERKVRDFLRENAKVTDK